MPDILDDADRAQDAFMREALSRIAKPTAPRGIGMCLHCGEEVEGERRWCDAAHRDAWEREQKRRPNA
jgi:hypothetical protein